MENDDFIKNNILTFVPPGLILFGTFGNIICLIVLNRSRHEKTSTSIYLSALALCDTLVLNTGLTRQWLKNAFDIDIRSFSEIGCKLHFFLVSFGLQLSSWILVAITIERVYSVWRPHRVKFGCTKKMAVKLLAAEVAILAILNVHILYSFQLESYNSNHLNKSGNETELKWSCQPDVNKSRYIEFMYSWWPWLDLCIVFLIPFCILLLGNIFILKGIQKSKRFHRKMSAYHSRSAGRDQKPLIPITAMLLTLNSVFFILVGPINVFGIGQFYWWLDDTCSEHGRAIGRLTWAVVNILMYTNNAVNFLLYIMCGAEFRNELKKLMKCSGRSSSQQGSAEMATNSVRLVNVTIEISNS